eukprot:12687874-Alexandrium_andersonii.AAC.1
MVADIPISVVAHSAPAQRKTMCGHRCATGACRLGAGNPAPGSMPRTPAGCFACRALGARQR